MLCGIEPGAAVKALGFDHESIAFPMSYGFPHPAGFEIVRQLPGEPVRAYVADQLAVESAGVFHTQQVRHDPPWPRLAAQLGPDPIRVFVADPHHLPDVLEAVKALRALASPLLTEGVGRIGIADDEAGAGDEEPEVHARSEAVVVRDSLEVLRKIDRLLAELDQAPLTILIEATVLSVRLDESTLPGVDLDQTDAYIEEGVLVVQGQRILPPELRRARIHRMELPQGRFERRLPLPRGHYDNVRRASQHGCLLVSLHKVRGGSR